jgi:multimeric flavodoxin WrbA
MDPYNLNNNINSQPQIKYGPEAENFYPFLNRLSGDKKVLFLTTSNRSPYVEKLGEVSKSSQLAAHLADLLRFKGVDVIVLDVAKLNIYPCLGCVSELHGNKCGVKESSVKDEKKNPTGNLRCWASHDFEDDELWKIVNELYESDSIVFFTSQRWGSANSIYQQLIERLDWIENMHSTLEQESTVSGKKAGFVCIGQNWRVEETVKLQKEVLSFFNFDTPDDLFIGWQFTRDQNDETEESYKQAPYTFEQSFNMELKIPEIKEDRSALGMRTFQDFLREIKWEI